MARLSCCVAVALALFIGRPAPAATAGGGAGDEGRSRLTFTERSPYSSLKEVCRAMEIDPKSFDAPDRAPATYDLAKESFGVFVPGAPKPGDPHGLLVYLSANVEPFPREWLGALRRHKLICVVPVYRGESGSTPCRCGLALDAVHNLKARYALDPARVYVAGYSAGATIASQLVRGRPDVFRGGLLLMGGPFYLPRERPDGAPPGRGAERDPVPPAWKGDADAVRKDTALVLVRGEADTLFPAAAGRADAEALKRDGFQRVTLIALPRHGHAPPGAAWFEKGLAALSARPDTGTRGTRSP